MKVAATLLSRRLPSEAAKARLRDCNIKPASLTRRPRHRQKRPKPDCGIATRNIACAFLALCDSQKRPKPDCGIATTSNPGQTAISWESEAAQARLRDCNRRSRSNFCVLM